MIPVLHVPSGGLAAPLLLGNAKAFGCGHGNLAQKGGGNSVASPGHRPASPHSAREVLKEDKSPHPLEQEQSASGKVKVAEMLEWSPLAFLRPQPQLLFQPFTSIQNPAQPSYQSGLADASPEAQSQVARGRADLAA